MAFEITSLNGSAKDIIRRVMHAENSQLLIPPTLEGKELNIEKPPSDGKYIGLFSSGTTSKPTCIWNSFEKLQKNAKYSAKAFEIETHHTLLMMALPWHVAGFSWMLMAENLECEYFFITTKKGEHNLWINTVQDINPDYMLTVPAVLRTLYDEDWFVSNVVYGGYPIKFEEYAKLSPHCSVMYQGYGQTEAGGLISSYKRRSTVLPFDLENLCQGKPISGVKLMCNGSQDAPQPIYIQSKTAFTTDRYDSGDVGFKDKKGNLYVVARSLVTNSLDKSSQKDLLT
ncbi:MAG: AMP-binding protein [Balneolaceae bacterium]